MLASELRRVGGREDVAWKDGAGKSIDESEEDASSKVSKVGFKGLWLRFLGRLRLRLCLCAMGTGPEYFPETEMRRCRGDQMRAS